MREIELVLDEIDQKLDQTRNLAIEAGGFTLFYLIEMALLETKEIRRKMPETTVHKLLDLGIR